MYLLFPTRLKVQLDVRHWGGNTGNVTRLSEKRFVNLKEFIPGLRCTAFVGKRRLSRCACHHVSSVAVRRLDLHKGRWKEGSTVAGYCIRLYAVLGDTLEGPFPISMLK